SFPPRSASIPARRSTPSRTGPPNPSPPRSLRTPRGSSVAADAYLLGSPIRASESHAESIHRALSPGERHPPSPPFGGGGPGRAAAERGRDPRGPRPVGADRGGRRRGALRHPRGRGGGSRRPRGSFAGGGGGDLRGGPAPR